MFSAPISNISVDGTNWIQPWDMLNLNVTCKGSGPFHKCLQFHRGKYNVTGNETCDNIEHLRTCNFSIIHYFLEPSVYTILIVLNNEVSTQIYPLTINIYKGKSVEAISTEDTSCVSIYRDVTTIMFMIKYSCSHDEATVIGYRSAGLLHSCSRGVDSIWCGILHSKQSKVHGGSRGFRFWAK